MQEPYFLGLTEPLDAYVWRHMDSHQGDPFSHSVPRPTHSIDWLLAQNQGRTYRGVHESCATEHPDEVLTCAMFSRERDGGTHYFHNLYLGPQTIEPQDVHTDILSMLGIDEEQYQASRMALSFE